MIFIIVIAAFAVAGVMLFGGEPASAEDEYPWIVPDSAAVSGMLDGSFYTGEKNSAGVLSYKIAEEITVESDGKVIYETGYIKPNQHIGEDVLDAVPEVGTYQAEAYFEGFDPDSEESIGSTKTALTITVLP